MANRLFAVLLFLTWASALPAHASRVTSLPRQLDEEAALAADTFIAAHFSLECGEDVFSHTGELYWQYRDFGWSVRPEPVTYKDTVFGVEWKGQLEIRAVQFRTHRPRAGSSRQPGWRQWHPLETIRISFQKNQGIWNFHSSAAHDQLPMGKAAPMCTELPEVTQ